MWNPVTKFICRKLNLVSTHVPTPPNSGLQYRQRRVLVIHSHPVPTSFSVAISHSVVAGLKLAGHEVRLKRLDFHGKPEECYNGQAFPPSLTQAERENMYKAEYVELVKNNQLEQVPWLAPEVTEAVTDLRWCDSVVLVFPTWMFSVPAALKGFLDRVLLPGVAFTLPDSSTASRAGATGLVACLTNIGKIGVVTTSSSSPLVMLYGGDGPRKMISRTLRVLCAPDCEVAWMQLHGMTRTTQQERERFLQDVEKSYAQF